MYKVFCVAGVVLLSACSTGVKKPSDYPVDQSSLPSVQSTTRSTTSQYPADGVKQSSSGTTYSSGRSSERQSEPTSIIEPQSIQLASLTEGSHHPAIAALFRQAEAARQQRQWRKALTYLDQARQIQPRNPAVLYRQAWIMMQLDQAPKAEQLLRRAKVFSGGDTALIRRLDWLLAESLEQQGRVNEADAIRP